MFILTPKQQFYCKLTNFGCQPRSVVQQNAWQNADSNGSPAYEASPLAALLCGFTQGQLAAIGFKSKCLVLYTATLEICKPTDEYIGFIMWIGHLSTQITDRTLIQVYPTELGWAEISNFLMEEAIFFIQLFGTKTYIYLWIRALSIRT